jgi:hypothetical protein
MIVHLVLFRPRATATAADRARLADVFSTALREIPSIRRARVGSRLTHGRAYEALMRTDYSHAAFLEFDDLPGLRAYLEHPAHEALGSLFFEMFEEALIYDFDMKRGEAGVADLLESRPRDS